MQTNNEISKKDVTIQAAVLDSLVNLAGELVLCRNQLLEAVNNDDKNLLESTSQRTDLVTTEIQEQLMRARMQPIGSLYNHLSQVVRDVAERCGKKVNLSITGKSVELDNTILKAIEDPLAWFIRKAVKYGIESLTVRNELNKPQQGSVELKAWNEAGQVIVEIFDDGKGVDPNTIVRKAVENGLILEKHAEELISESEKMSMIFLPDLLTDQNETDYYSQFVGIEAIKSRLEKIGGSLNVDSILGHGTHVCIKLPLILSIIPSQIIRLGNERFAIPQANLDELLRIPANQVKHRIEKVGDASVIRLRGELLPVIDLANVLGIDRMFVHPSDRQSYPDRRKNIYDRRSKDHSAPVREYDGNERRLCDDRRHNAQSAVNIAIVSTGTYKYGLVIEAMNDSEEIVVKPLGKHLKSCPGFAGATIMGDGKVALILDVASIGKMSHLKSDSKKILSEELTNADEPQEIESPYLKSYLFFYNSGNERFAVPLEIVERIEKIKATTIETISGVRTLKYRGGTLPLFALDDAIRVNPLPDKSHYLVICFKVNGKEFGVISTPPIDCAEVEITLDKKTLKQPGVLGSAVIMDKTTMVLDVKQIVKNVKPDYFKGV